MRGASAATLAILSLMLGAMAATPQSAKAPGPAKIIGVWNAVKTRDVPGEASVEFTADGKMHVTIMMPNGSIEKKSGTYIVDGEKLRITLPEGGKDRTQTVKIRRLTENRRRHDAAVADVIRVIRDVLS